MNILYPMTFCATLYFLFQHVCSFSENESNGTRFLSTSLLNSFFGTSQINGLGEVKKTTEAEDMLSLVSKLGVSKKNKTSDQFISHYPTLNKKPFQMSNEPLLETLSIMDVLKYLGDVHNNTDRHTSSNSPSFQNNLSFVVPIRRRKTNIEQPKTTQYNTAKLSEQVPLSNMNGYNLQTTNKKLLVLQPIFQKMY